MSVPISDRLFLNYLQCKYKAYLKISGKSGIKSDFESFQDEKLIAYRSQVRKHFLQRNQVIVPTEIISQFKEIKKHKPDLATHVSIVNNSHELILDAVEFAADASAEKPVYQPIMFLPRYNISKISKLLLAFCGIALSDEQKMVPTRGRIILGNQVSSYKIQLTTLIKTANKIEKEIVKIMELKAAPLLRLNDH